MKIENGYIKFNCIWTNKNFKFPDPVYNNLNFWRNKLYGLNLIGCYTNGIGFGNISIKTSSRQFIITGSATGSKPLLLITSDRN